MSVGSAVTQTQWFRLLIGTLVQAGVRHVVVSPGSRSTPLVTALQRCPALSFSVCIDERAAAFVALGWARASGEICAAVCTSGTAPAHYFPAVLEAAHSCLPLLVISADRPPELQRNGSAQTIDQTRLFGGHVRAFVELGAPDPRTAAFAGLRRKLTHSVALTRGTAPGPVHINAPAFKPLEPASASTDEEALLESFVDTLLASEVCTFHQGALGPTATTVDVLAKRWSAAERPVLFCGPESVHADVAVIERFATRVRWPILAEITHPLRQNRGSSGALVLDAFDLIARVQPPHLRPDLVVTLGATATSSAWLRWIEQMPAVKVDAIAAQHLVDPLNRAQTVVVCDAAPLLELVGGEMQRLTLPRTTNLLQEWSQTWNHTNTRARATVAHYLTTLPESVFVEPQVFAAVAQHIAPGESLMLGNSLPIRVAETFFDARVPFYCLSQRGVNGIDGLIAGAAGAALAASRRTWLMLGDVSALHDVGSLRLLATLGAPVVVIIVDNNGGRIFDALPIARTTTDLNPWTTPHATDFGALALAMGLAVTTVSTLAELHAALPQLPESSPAVVWCKVHTDGAQLAYQSLVANLRTGLAP